MFQPPCWCHTTCYTRGNECYGRWGRISSPLINDTCSHSVTCSLFYALFSLFVLCYHCNCKQRIRLMPRIVFNTNFDKFLMDLERVTKSVRTVFLQNQHGSTKYLKKKTIFTNIPISLINISVRNIRKSSTYLSTRFAILEPDICANIVIGLSSLGLIVFSTNSFY